MFWDDTGKGRPEMKDEGRQEKMNGWVDGWMRGLAVVGGFKCCCCCYYCYVGIVSGIGIVVIGGSGSGSGRSGKTGSEYDERGARQERGRM